MDDGPVAFAAPPARVSEEEWSELIGRWLTDHIYSSPVAQNTAGWNHLMMALPKLRDYVNEHLGKEG